MRISTRLVLLAALVAGSARGATAGVVLTFEGLQNFEQVSNYYDGGTGSLGSGPGPDYGVTVSPFGLAYIPGQQTGHVTPFPNDPSPPTVLLLFDPSNPLGAGAPTSMTLDVSPGFSGELTFYQIVIGRTASVQIYSGLDGTGTLLADQSLAITPEAFPLTPTPVDFSGVAHSIVFAGGNDQVALDDIAFTNVPEPSAWLLLAAGVAGSLPIISRWRKAAASR